MKKNLNPLMSRKLANAIQIIMDSKELPDHYIDTTNGKWYQIDVERYETAKKKGRYISLQIRGLDCK